MPRAGTAARKCERQGLPPVKPGKRGWVYGSKLPFFEVHRNAYLTAAEMKSTGDFYDKVSQLYLKTYGYNTGWNEDLDEGQDVADDVDPDEDEEAEDDRTEREREERAAYFKVLRGKVGAWYKSQYGGSVEKKQKKVTFTQVFDNSGMDPPAPVKPRVLHWYSRHFWHERVKERFNARWAAVSRRQNPPALITVWNTVTKEAWHSETDAFKEEVLAAIDKNHKIAMEAYAVATSGDAPTTPQEYNIALNNAAYYLQPFADAIQERFGMNVAILMCGPIADRGGRIEVRSVHAGMSNGLVPMIWGDFDRAGFDSVQRSFVDFTHNCFTEAECRARSLNEIATGGDSAGMGDSLQDKGDEEPLATGSVGGDVGGAVSDDAQGVTLPPVTSNDAQSMTPAQVTSNSAQCVTPTKITPNGAQSVAPAEITPNGAGMTTPEEPVGTGTTTGGGDDDSDFGGPIDPIKALNAMHNSATFDPRNDPIFKDLELSQLLFGVRPPLQIGLRAMTVDEVEMENDFARNRVFLRRINEEGMSAIDAIMRGGEEETAAAGCKGKEAAQQQVQQQVDAPPVQQRPKPRPRHRGSAEGSGLAPNPILPQSARPEPSGDAAHLPSPPPRAVEGEEEQRRVEGEAAAAEKGGVGPIWSADVTGWQDELHKAFRAFERGKAWGGTEWERCVTALIAMEKAWNFPNKGILSAPNGQDDERPEEIPEFMRLARKWDSPVNLASEIGPRSVEGSFSQRWWSWWGHAQPESRQRENGEWRATVDLKAEDWTDVAKMHGRNGLLLYVGGLLWWGEAAAADNAAAALLADWKLTVDDVSGVLAAAVKSLRGDPSAKAKETKSAPQAATRKRKAPATSAAPDKENNPPKKRTRSRR
ncbi:hypothetical protein B0H13DRAFT_1919665 [Mycena leptocephala]|nr:hypothetical protein B0H13DRAFT_1919665 [Mycena leptocephala]